MNKIMLSGRVTKEIELNKKGDTTYTNFSLAVYKSKEETNFFDCVAFNKLADIMGGYVVKGQQISIIGHLDITKNPTTGQYSYKIIVDELELGQKPKEK